MIFFITIWLTNLLFLTIASICVFKIIMNYKIVGHYKWFILMGIFGIIQSIIVNLMSEKEYKSNVNVIRDLIFSIYVLIEFFTLLYFFYNEIKSIKIKTLLKFIASTAVSIVFIGYAFDINFIVRYYQTICLIEAGLMILLSINIIVETLFDDSITSLTKSHRFLIASGIFFLFNITLPYFILTKYLTQYNYNSLMYLSVINLVGYIFFYFSLSRSISCICLTKDNRND